MSLLSGVYVSFCVHGRMTTAELAELATLRQNIRLFSIRVRVAMLQIQ